jgi:hypothetical protein
MPSCVRLSLLRVVRLPIYRGISKAVDAFIRLDANGDEVVVWRAHDESRGDDLHGLGVCLETGVISM